MHTAHKKLGFWAALALVAGSQISSGVFILPTSLAPFGAYTFLGWLVAGLGAVGLAWVFGQLCMRYPETGGPHVYVQKVFGDFAAYCTGWTYWIISWISTTVVFAACVGYLKPVIGLESPLAYFLVQLGLLIVVTALNLHNAQLVGRAELFLTILKLIPLVALPLIIFPSFSLANLVIEPSLAQSSFFSILSRIVLITFWGFIGLESATAPAGAVQNPHKTIPLALVIGTSLVGLLYLFNSLSIMGAVPGDILSVSTAPYVTAAQQALGGNWGIAIAIISSVVCLSTLNAWTLTSGQIAYGLAKSRLFPAFFARETKGGAPLWGIIASSCGITPILALLCNKSLHEQIAAIIDISVVSFLFVYLICCLALLKVLKNEGKLITKAGAITLFATLFCLWIISQASLATLALAGTFTAVGVVLLGLTTLLHT